VLEKAPNGLTYDLLKDLVYIEWIINETMRISPAVPSIGNREVLQDTTLGDWHLPAKTIVNINLVSMFSDPNIWKSPEEFNPERWSPQNLTKEQRNVFFPFSRGPRVCMGMNFSLIEQKVFLATILREFSSFSTSKDCVIETVSKAFLSGPNFDKLTLQFVRA